MELPEIAPPSPGPLPLLRHVVGDILRGLRREQQRTLRDVADTAQVSMAYLSEVERGRKEASSEVLAAICRALGITVLDLVARAHEELQAVVAVRALTTLTHDLSGPRHPRAATGFTGPSVSLLAA